MTLYYSLKTNGFYDTSMHYDKLPTELIEITPAKHSELLLGLNSNKEIKYVDEKLILVEIPHVSPTWESIRRERNTLLVQSDYTQLLDWPGDKQAWSTYRQQLRDIPQAYSETTQVIWPTAPK